MMNSRAEDRRQRRALQRIYGYEEDAHDDDDIDDIDDFAEISSRSRLRMTGNCDGFDWVAAAESGASLMFNCGADRACDAASPGIDNVVEFAPPVLMLSWETSGATDVKNNRRGTAGVSSLARRLGCDDTHTRRFGSDADDTSSAIVDRAAVALAIPSANRGAHDGKELDCGSESATMNGESVYGNVSLSLSEFFDNSKTMVNTGNCEDQAPALGVERTVRSVGASGIVDELPTMARMRSLSWDDHYVSKDNFYHNSHSASDSIVYDENGRKSVVCAPGRKRKILFAAFGLIVAVIALVGITLQLTVFRASPAAAEDLDADAVEWIATTSQPTYGPTGGSDPSSVTWVVNDGSTKSPTSTSPTPTIGQTSSSPSPGSADPTVIPTMPPETFGSTSTVPTASAPMSTESTSTAPSELANTPIATCGNGDRGNGICPIEGDCCSHYGWCGNTAKYCKMRQPTDQPTRPPQASAQDASSITEGKIDAVDSKSRLSIELRTDKHGEETSWTLYSVDSKDRQIRLIASVEENTYDPFEEDFIELELDPGKYRFTLKDSFGDGFCCSNGSDGMFALYLDGRELIRGDSYRFELSYDIIAGNDPESSMSDRDMEWLVAHNTRRQSWHQRHGETYVPLMWSAKLANDALSWATELLNDCEIEGIKHEPGVEQGENLAKNRGSTGGGMGKIYPADNVRRVLFRSFFFLIRRSHKQPSFVIQILTRWVENEETWPYPNNAHLTQALWRASRYLGCGDAVKNYSDGSICRIQVCR
jgi:hypothetical protein